MSITAIITHYWESRTEGLARIVHTLRTGEVRPAQILIWNNLPASLSVEGADVCNAGRNWGIAARFAAAYLARTEYVLFQDNDLTVQAKTLANLLDHAPTEGESIELQGRLLGPQDAPYSRSEYVTGVDRIVDVGLSRLSLMRRSTAVHLAAIVPPDAVDDDLWASRHSRIHIVPFGVDEGYVNLPEREGLSLNAVPHVLRRDALVKQLWWGGMGMSA